MIDNRPEQNSPDDDGRNEQSQSREPVRKESFENAEFGTLLSASRIVHQIERNLSSPEVLTTIIDSELSRIDLLPDELSQSKERENLLYAFSWALGDLMGSVKYGMSDLLNVFEQGARVFEKLADRPLLGAPSECERFFSKLLETLDSLYDDARHEPAIQPRLTELFGYIGRGIGAESVLGRTSFHSNLEGPFDRMQVELSELLYTRLADLANFEAFRAFPDNFPDHEIRLTTALIDLGSQARLCDLRELYHFVLVRTYSWLLKHVPEVGEMGGQPLPEAEIVTHTSSYQDSDYDDHDAPWRESLEDEVDREGEEDGYSEIEGDSASKFPEDFGPVLVPSDASQRVFSLNHLFLSTLEGLRNTLSPHPHEESSKRTRECLSALIEDLGPDWFAWTPVLSVYASISADCLKEARVPLKEKLVYPLLHGNSAFADFLLEFIEGGRDQLELLADVLRELKRRQRDALVEAIRGAGSEIEWEILDNNGQPQVLFSPTVERLIEAIERPAGRYLT